MKENLEDKYNATIKTFVKASGTFLAEGLLNISSLKFFTMLRWTIIFAIIAVIAAIFGFGGVAASAAGIAKVLFFIFVVLFIISLIMGRRSV